jgi:hypothetical protein
MSEELRVEQHVLRVDPEDVITVSWSGYIAGEHAKEIYTQMRRIARGKEPVFYVVDISRAITTDAEGRRLTADLLDIPGLRGIALVGASFHVRVIAMLTIKLIVAFGKLRNCPIVFFPNLEKAHVWIDERRKALTAPM